MVSVPRLRISPATPIISSLKEFQIAQNHESLLQGAMGITQKLHLDSREPVIRARELNWTRIRARGAQRLHTPADEAADTNRLSSEHLPNLNQNPLCDGPPESDVGFD